MPKKVNLRILVVEDVADISDSYKFHLENAGFVVDIVETRKGAIEALTAKYYDVALVDLHLKDDDVTFKGGFAVLDVIKTLQEGTKAIVASGTSEIEDSVASYDKGIKSYIIKGPITSKDIIEKIKDAVKDHTQPLFGDFQTLSSYLAAPEVTPIWEDPIQSALGCGYDGMHKILWNALRPYLPILRRKDGTPSMIVDKTQRAVAGAFWSKAEGFAIWVSIRGEGGTFIEPEQRDARRIADFEGKKVAAAAWRIDLARDLFLETLRDRPSRKA